MARHRLLTFAIVWVLLACSRAPDEAELAGVLVQSPDDDAAWSATLDSAAEQDRLRPFATAATALAARSTDAWAPAWIAGEAWVLLEETEKAETQLRVGLERARRSDIDVGIAQTANELGWIAYDRGALDEGALLYEEGIAASLRAGRDDLEAFLRNNLAGLRVEQGRLAAARDELELASAKLSELGMDGPAAGLRYNRAALEWSLGNLLAAEATLEQVRESAERAGDTWTVAASQVIEGHIARARGEYDRAVEAYVAVEHDDADVAATAALGIALVERSRGNGDRSQQYFQRAAEIAASDEPLIAALAGAFHGDGLFDSEGREEGKAALETSIRDADAAGDSQTAWVARHLLGRRWLDLAPERARRWLDEAVERLEERGGDLDALGDGLYLLRGRSEVYVDAARAAIDDPARFWELAGLSTGRALRAVAPPEATPDLASAQRRLAVDEAILVIQGAGGGGLALLVTSNSVATSPIVLPEPAEIRSWTAALRGGSASGSISASGILHPFGDTLRRIDRLWLVVDSSLASLPFGALTWEDQYFGTRFAYAVLPTTGAPAATPTDPEEREALLAGAPLFEGEGETWAPLPFAAQEIARLDTLWQGRATRLAGDALRVAELEGLDWEDFGWIHFATHAEASTLDPRANGLILSDGERFGLDQVLAARFPGSTVILSACRSAEGERVPGQGRLGLVWAFHVAGARDVVASQWTIDDRATVETMVALHQSLLAGNDAAEAMRSARRTAVESGRPRESWAAFEVYRRP